MVENPKDQDEKDMPDESDMDAEDDGRTDVDTCPSCHVEIYSDADRCPNCGHYLTGEGITSHSGFRKVAFWAILVPLLVMLAAYIFLTIMPYLKHGH